MKMSIPTPFRRTLIIVVLGLWAMSNVGAAELHIECPKEISPRDVRLVRAPAGWTPFVPFEYTPGIPLHSAGVMYGPPSDMATLKPGGTGAPNEDVFPDLRPGKEGNWIACFYGEGQDFILSKRLPDTVSECRIAYSKVAKKRYMVDIRCR